MADTTQKEKDEQNKIQKKLEKEATAFVTKMMKDNDKEEGDILFCMIQDDLAEHEGIDWLINCQRTVLHKFAKFLQTRGVACKLLNPRKDEPQYALKEALAGTGHDFSDQDVLTVTQHYGYANVSTWLQGKYSDLIAGRKGERPRSLSPGLKAAEEAAKRKTEKEKEKKVSFEDDMILGKYKKISNEEFAALNANDKILWSSWKAAPAPEGEESDLIGTPPTGTYSRPHFVKFVKLVKPGGAPGDDDNSDDSDGNGGPPGGPPAPKKPEEPPRNENKHKENMREEEESSDDDGMGHTYSRALLDLAKLYSHANHEKYGKASDHMALKLRTFKENAVTCSLPKEAWKIAMPRWLKDDALDYLITTLREHEDYGTFTFRQCTKAIENYFEDDRYRLQVQTEWDTQELAAVMSKNPALTTTECFEKLVKKLQYLRHGLTLELRGDLTFHMRLVKACLDVEDCQSACSNPPYGVHRLIAAIRQSITNAEHIKFRKQGPHSSKSSMNYENSSSSSPTPSGSPPSPSTSYVVDRRYMSNTQPQFRGRFPGPGGSTLRGSPGTFKPHFGAAGARKQLCFICKKENHRSWQHTQEERDDHNKRFRERTQGTQAQYIMYQQDVEGLQDVTGEITDEQMESDFHQWVQDLADVNNSSEHTMYNQLANNAAEHAMTGHGGKHPSG